MKGVQVVMGEIVNEVKYIDIGDKSYPEDQVTPSIYFEYVKGLKQQVNYAEYDIIIDTALKMMEKTKITGQVNMAKKLTHQVELALRELDAAKAGFDIFVNRKDIERYIQKVEKKVIKVIELKNYSREIPDEVIDKIAKAREIFDELYIVFTDYTNKEAKKVAKARRDKDPIVFGAFKDTDESNNSNRPYLEDRFFFIADWVDEKCDLTLEQIVHDVQDTEDREITYRVSVDDKDEEAVKKFITSLDEPVEDLEPVSIFAKLKKMLPSPKKEKDETETKTTTTGKKKRGRPRKKKVDDES